MAMNEDATPVFEAFRKFFGLDPGPARSGSPPERPNNASPEPGRQSTTPGNRPVEAGRFTNLAADPELEETAARLLRGIGEHRLANEIHVAYYPRLKSTAGLAVWAHRLVLLNPLLHGLAEDEPGHTLRHELAHLVAQRRAGRRRIAAHGPEWRQACADLGIPNAPSRHSLPLPRREQARPYHYQCPACRAIVRRARPFRHVSACYECCRKFNNGRYDQTFRFQRIATAPVCGVPLVTDHRENPLPEAVDSGD